jgi:hypothetical protein
MDTFKDRLKVIVGLGVTLALLGACGGQHDAASEASTEPTSAGAALAVDPAAKAVTPASAGTSTSPVKDDFPPPCSICSDFACQTRSLNAACTQNGVPGFCLNVSGGTCHTDGLITCKCARGVP